MVNIFLNLQTTLQRLIKGQFFRKPFSYTNEKTSKILMSNYKVTQILADSNTATACFVYFCSVLSYFQELKEIRLHPT